MNSKVLTAKVTLINCAEENIEEHTNKERVHRHLPTKRIKSNDDVTVIFDAVK